MSGCHVENNKNGDNKDVKIATPFGGMQVKTNDASVPGDIGLPTYPGATITKKDNDHDSQSADVNMSFGSFQMRVKAVSYRTDDSPGQSRSLLSRWPEALWRRHRLPQQSLHQRAGPHLRGAHLRQQPRQPHLHRQHPPAKESWS